MRVVVLVKCVPDTETRVKIASDGKSLVESDIKWVISPFDEYALEEGLRLVERFGDGSVTLVSMGDERGQPALRQGLAMGAHRAIHLLDPAFVGSDGLATARVLAAACRKLDFDIILSGRQGVGEDRSQVPVMVAELLDLPHVAVVTKLEIAADRVTAWREIEGGQEVFETSLPVVVSAQKGLNEPRYASLKGIMAAKKKPIDVWDAATLGLDPAACGRAGSHEIWTRLELPVGRPAAKMLKGTASEVAAQLVELLSAEAKVL